jgi:hypothetical protein
MHGPTVLVLFWQLASLSVDAEYAGEVAVNIKYVLCERVGIIQWYDFSVR